MRKGKTKESKKKNEPIKNGDSSNKQPEPEINNYKVDHDELSRLNNVKLTRRIVAKFTSLKVIFNRKNKGINNAIINFKAYQSIKNNNLLDHDYYLKNYPDVQASGMDPIIHYMYHGYLEGRKPNPEFNVDYYMRKYGDVKNSNLNPLVHYSLYGINEGRKINRNHLSKKMVKERFNNGQKDLEVENKGIMNDKKPDPAIGTKGKKETSSSDYEGENITVPHYDDLKLTLKGQDGYLFLINDSNNEIYQHYEKSYQSNFEADILIENIKSKKVFCGKRNIDYYFFIVPDKSLVCKDILPFEVKTIKRNCDSLKDLVPDFIDKLDPTHYFKNDTHINYLGGMELAYNYLNHIDNNFTRKEFDRLIEEQIHIFDHYYSGDLTWDRNWSYSSEERNEYLNEKIKMCGNKFFVFNSQKIPKKFKFAGKRETTYLKNPKGLKDLKVLILRDSSMVFLIESLSVYFSDLLLYYDHWVFNKELVEYYQPDIIIEVRTERFLENMKELVNMDI
jgi:hypothetical protein